MSQEDIEKSLWTIAARSFDSQSQCNYDDNFNAYVSFVLSHPSEHNLLCIQTLEKKVTHSTNLTAILGIFKVAYISQHFRVRRNAVHSLGILLSHEAHFSEKIKVFLWESLDKLKADGNSDVSKNAVILHGRLKVRHKDIGNM
jgi:hypothetical protein